MGFAAPLLMAAGTGLGAASAIQEGRIASAEARSAARMELYNAGIAERNARAEEKKTTFEQIRHQKASQRQMGSLLAGLGASGAEVSEGAPLSLLADQAGEFALENALIGIEGRTRAGQYESEATLRRTQVGIYRQRAGNLRRAGIVKAAGTLLSGFGGMTQEGYFSGKKAS